MLYNNYFEKNYYTLCNDKKNKTFLLEKIKNNGDTKQMRIIYIPRYGAGHISYTAPASFSFSKASF